MRCLVTGATGFVGQHLSDRLLKAGHDVVGLARRVITLTGQTATLHAIDLLDAPRLRSFVLQERFDWVFHLAGAANPGQSFRDPRSAWQGNLDATLSLYDALLSLSERPRVLFASTGLVYGNASPGHALTERDELRPTSPYAASKAAADVLSHQVSSQGLPVVRVRSFTHIGPGQSADYAVANFARQIATAEHGNGPAVIQTGDLSSERDLTDVRDVVDGYIRLIEFGQPGEAYNLASGKTVRMRDVLAMMLQLARTEGEVREQPDPNRRGDTNSIRVNIDRLRATTHWSPARPLEQTLQDVLNDWRTRVD